MAVGNREGGTETVTAADDSTYVKIKPDVVSWRDITIGESQYQCINMTNDALNKYGWDTTVDSHLIKNNELGAVVYLCYSAFGSVPQINANGQSGTNWYNMHTGAGPSATDNETRYDSWNAETNGYNTALGQLASTTGNVYGIYDMSGGAWERVAAYYDNGNKNLNTYGKSSNHGGSTIEYFTWDESSKKAAINSAYEKYWEAYEVSEEEKSNSIIVGEEQLTQADLWGTSKTEDKYEQKRHDLTEETWNKLAKVKGIGMNEVAGSWAYKGLVNGTTINWKTDPASKDRGHGKAWNSDGVLMGSAGDSFLSRGGSISDEARAGALYSDANAGWVWYGSGFRPTLAF